MRRTTPAAIFCDTAAEVGRVALLTELTDCPSRESDSGTDATATVGSLPDSARRSVSDFCAAAAACACNADVATGILELVNSATGPAELSAVSAGGRAEQTDRGASVLIRVLLPVGTASTTPDYSSSK